MKRTKKIILKRDGEEQKVGPKRGCQCGLCQRDAMRGRKKGPRLAMGAGQAPDTTNAEGQEEKSDTVG